VLKELKATLEQQAPPEPMVLMAHLGLKELKALKAQQVIADQQELQDPLVEMESDLQDLKELKVLQD
jgi:hypothetical protein